MWRIFKITLNAIVFVLLPVFLAGVAWGLTGAIVTLIAMFLAQLIMMFRSYLPCVMVGIITGGLALTVVNPVFPIPGVYTGSSGILGYTASYWIVCFILGIFQFV